MNTTLEKNKECIDICNGLLRGEKSAVETYNSAIEKFSGEPSVGALRELKQTHSEAVGLLEQNVRSMGGDPTKESGAWGAFANAVQSAANFFGESSAVSSLQKGEEHGKSSYENALEKECLLLECANLIRSSLLPNVISNIERLDTLEDTL